MLCKPKSLNTPVFLSTPSHCASVPDRLTPLAVPAGPCRSHRCIRTSPRLTLHGKRLPFPMSWPAPNAGTSSITETTPARMEELSLEFLLTVQATTFWQWVLVWNVCYLLCSLLSPATLLELLEGSNMALEPYLCPFQCQHLVFWGAFPSWTPDCLARLCREA